METLIVACNTIRNELEKAARECECPYGIEWVDSGLHLVPESLRRRLQEELDKISGVQRVVLAFGYCGHSVLGLKTGDYQLIIPRVNDCISLLLGSEEERERCCQKGGIYFLTKGWLEEEVNIWNEYQDVLERFGAERTERVYQRILAHYKFLGLIDTGAYELEPLLPNVREIASTLKLELLVLKGSDQYLKRMLTGPWTDEQFVIIPPHTTIEFAHLRLDQAGQPSALQGIS